MTDARALTFDDMVTACSRGGASALTFRTELKPAAGPQALIAPAKYVKKRGRANEPVYAFSTRSLDGAHALAVTIDSYQSVGNRVEKATSDARRDSSSIAHAVLARVPSIEVRYPDSSFSDWELPHRAFDGHIRAGSVEGRPVTEHPRYRAARDATVSSARALLDLSPVTLVMGGWDSTRKSHQGRYRRAFEGEIIGFLADQEADPNTLEMRGGARVDPVAASVKLGGQDMRSLLDHQRVELSAKNVDKLEAEIRKAKSGTTSAASLGLGAIPPSLATPAGVACSRIIRSHVLSFATLRQMRFGGSPESDVALRAVLATLALLGMALSDEELYLRANCDLVEASEPAGELDGRYGHTTPILALDVTTATELFAAALDHAQDVADLDWHGQVFEVLGDERILHGASAEEDEDAE